MVAVKQVSYVLAGSAVRQIRLHHSFLRRCRHAKIYTLTDFLDNTEWLTSTDNREWFRKKELNHSSFYTLDRDNKYAITKSNFVADYRYVPVITVMFIIIR